MVTHCSGWQSKMWFVTVIDGNAPASRYKQIFIFQNHRRSPAYAIALTFFHKIRNRYEEYKGLFAPKMLTAAYFGQETVSKIMKMMYFVSVRLFTRFLAALWKITNDENPGIHHMRQNTNPDSSNVSTTDPRNQSS